MYFSDYASFEDSFDRCSSRVDERKPGFGNSGDVEVRCGAGEVVLDLWNVKDDVYIQGR